MKGWPNTKANCTELAAKGGDFENFIFHQATYWEAGR